LKGEKMMKDYVTKEKQFLKKYIKDNELNPTLAIVQVGDDDPASNAYIKGKIKDCDELGIEYLHLKFTGHISQRKFNDEIMELNRDKNIDGIIVQLPLPKHLILNTHLIYPDKDVDGFSYDSSYIPCTPSGIYYYLCNRGVEVDGKNVVIIGRSDIVGKPMAKLMLDMNATVTVCHSHTKDISMYTKIADIIIVAVGKRNILTRDMIGDNRPIVIDVGINRDENGKLCGDCDYDNLVDICEYVSPVPGGVGLLTRLTLMRNVVMAAERRRRG
jgi:methylenetetrahydrofolate dehydrogenase (NADP+)/methenyltetrahydrofolate cyclohydrolase